MGRAGRVVNSHYETGHGSCAIRTIFAIVINKIVILKSSIADAYKVMISGGIIIILGKYNN